MNVMSIDLETRSSVDINKAGVYRYTESPDFDILLFGVSIDGGPVQVYDLASGEELPEEIIKALLDPEAVKWAYNAAFERICISEWLRRKGLFGGDYLSPESWRCSMVWAAYNGLPLALAKSGAVLGLDQQKLKEGKDLIRYFCTPSKTSGRDFNLPEHAPDRWELFKKYNKRDIEVELAIKERLKNYPVPDFVWQEYWLDQRINDRGIMIDRRLVAHAMEIDEKSKKEIMLQMQRLTGLENPYSVMQLKEYLVLHGMVVDSLGKQEVQKMLETAPADIAPILSLRLQLAKSSVRKYQAMKTSVCRDDRCHGMFQFYGANRSGRWAGRIIQLQNLYRNSMPDLADARELVRQGDYEILDMLYPSVPEVLAQLVRTAFIPSPGSRFIVADFSAIEARVLSHLAGEDWRSDVFRCGGDIYCASASQMFGVPVEKHGVNGHLRQKGKIAELALGYGGSTGALKAMGALDMGLTEDELQPLVSAWRSSNPNIVQYWWDVDRAVKTAIRDHVPTRVGCVNFFWKSGMLFIELPSGRRLAYVKPRIGINRFGGESVNYMGIDAQKKWSRIESYGPKFAENIVQAISRDLLAAAMLRLSEYRIVGHVHDEVIIEAGSEVSLQDVCRVMSKVPDWLPGIELRADGYECDFYMKD